MAVRLSPLRAGRPILPGRFLVLISVTRWVDPRAIVRLEGLGKLKKIYINGTRSRDCPARSIMPQTTTLPRAAVLVLLWGVEPFQGNGSVNMFPRQQIRMQQPIGAVGKGVLYSVHAEGVISRPNEARIDSCKGAVVQKGLESGSRRIAIIKSCHQATTSEDTAGWKRLSVTGKVWKSASVLVICSCP
jgi:hypothetical protein